ncbi:MAG: PEP-CTERM sorting domain-containing protein [Phycisphaeraceae bacterium]|nr:PEP-CTERM sorting domain-containing protein [Phycisphaeraceae bacterium]
MKTHILLAAVATTAIGAGSAQAASFVTDFQATIASEQHPDYADEARYYHVSVNPNNPGTGSYAATIVGTNNPAPTFVRNFTEDVVGYKFAGGVNNDITAVAQSGGDAGRIVFDTTDASFDGFGQQQAKVWTTTDPGADIQTTIADPFAAVDDVGGTGGWRSLGGATGTFDITGLATGSVHFYYGAFGAKPTISAVMRDTDGGAADIVIADAHLNDDSANRTEYYLAELDFVTDGVYDEIVVTWDSDGDGNLSTGNGRGVAAVLTGTVPEPGSLALLGLGSLLIARRRRA